MLVRTSNGTVNVSRLGIIVMPEHSDGIAGAYIVFRHTDNKLYRTHVWPMIRKTGPHVEASQYATLIDGCPHCCEELKALNIMIDRNLPPFAKVSYPDVYKFVSSFDDSYDHELHAEYNIHAFYGGK